MMQRIRAIQDPTIFSWAGRTLDPSQPLQGSIDIPPGTYDTHRTLVCFDMVLDTGDQGVTQPSYPDSILDSFAVLRVNGIGLNQQRVLAKIKRALGTPRVRDQK